MRNELKLGGLNDLPVKLEAKRERKRWAAINRSVSVIVSLNFHPKTRGD